MHQDEAVATIGTPVTPRKGSKAVRDRYQAFGRNIEAKVRFVHHEIVTSHLSYTVRKVWDARGHGAGIPIPWTRKGVVVCVGGGVSRRTAAWY
jgi:hypothetical protein